MRIIVGLGKTGLSCVKYFSQRQLPIVVMDTRDQPPALIELQRDFPEVPILCGPLDLQLLLQAQEIILSPGMALQDPVIQACRAQGIPILGDIELFARVVTAPVVAITGSNAKSTVTTLVGLMVQQAGKQVLVGGNIGTPVLDLLEQPTPDIYVLELSSFQLETTYSLTCAVAVLLNISADHMDRYTSLQDYWLAKQRIYQQAQAAVWNRDDHLTQPMGRQVATSITFGLGEATEQNFGITKQQQQNFLARGTECLLAVAALPIKGRHNWANALAALAIGTQLGLPMAVMLQVLRTFPGLTHRCQWVAERQGVHWYNDSKGTNVGATLAAINGLGADSPGKLILIAGGDGKGASFADLVVPVANAVRAVILIGRDALRLGETLAQVAQVLYAVDLPTAVQLAATVAIVGDYVLLSPACASIDMFNNYEHRGEVFMQAVREL